MALRNGTRRVVGVAALLLTLAGCSHDPDDKLPRFTPSPSPSSSRPTAPADTAAAEQSIRAAWTKFFAPKTSLKDRQSLLENGKLLTGVLQTYDTSTGGGAEIKDIRFASDKRALVTYTLTGTAKNATGTAIEQAGAWKISASTLCGLPKPTPSATSQGAPVC
ncbi:hypothetical protein [Streptomyces niveiscabiei]|uniref:Low molecular weight antigen MTB12-like C-terminal domain-containing protein n=1 Tax=Streptomyces niveiscabiei TaxID=164115 RepID=A0ABW9HX85_9ACTN